MIDQLRQMAIFAKTVDHGSFRGAAQELRLSPSVISHHVSQLEDHLGVALMYRSTRKLTLTSEGERLLAAAHNMLGAVEGELSALTASSIAPSGELKITIASMLAHSKIATQLVEFAAKYPRIKLSLDFSDTRRELIEGGYDLAIRMSEHPKRSATTRRLFKTPRIAVSSARYLSAWPEIKKPAELEEMNWLALSPHQVSQTVFRGPDGTKSSIRPNLQIVAHDAQALFCLVRAGAGIAIVPDFLAERDLASGDVIHVLPDWTLNQIDVFAMWHANAPKHGLTHLLLEAISSKA